MYLPTKFDAEILKIVSFIGDQSMRHPYYLTGHSPPLILFYFLYSKIEKTQYL